MYIRYIILAFYIYSTFNVYSQNPIKEYFPTGELKMIRTKSGNIETTKQYFKSGKIKSLDIYNVVFLDEKWTGYYENGNVSETGTFLDGVKNGTWKYYRETGKMEALEIYSIFKNTGKPKMDESNYDENGKISSKGTLISNWNTKKYVEEGLWTFYHPNGKVSKTGSYKEGKWDGLWKFYDHEGRMTGNAEYLNHKAHGTYKTFFKNGNTKQQSIYINGLKDGNTTLYYQNGKTQSIANYTQDKLNGVMITYWDNGAIGSSVQYDLGKLMNVDYIKDMNGKDLDKGTVKDGNGTFKSYLKDGSLYKEYQIINGQIKN